MNGEILPRELNRPLVEPTSENEGPFKFSMVQRGDFIKPGSWHWRCRREDAAGDVDYGYVVADSLGHIVAPETFEKDGERRR